MEEVRKGMHQFCPTCKTLMKAELHNIREDGDHFVVDVWLSCRHKTTMQRRINRNKTIDGYVLRTCYRISGTQVIGFPSKAEHIWVWEQAHRKALPVGWCIHHINGIKDDNRLENLFAMPKNKHERALAFKLLHIEQPNHLVTCPKCNHKFQP